MSSSHHFMIISLEQSTNNCNEVVTHFLMYFTISQIVSGNGSMGYAPYLLTDRSVGTPLNAK